MSELRQPQTVQPGQQPQPLRPPPLAPQPQTPQQPAKIAPLPVQSLKQPTADLDPISLVDTPAPNSGGAQSTMSKIKISAAATHVSHTYTRQPVATGHGAIRVRTFHGRLSDEGMAFMDDKINEWIDQHPEVEVKFVTTTIGQFEGKIREPALVVNVWY